MQKIIVFSSYWIGTICEGAPRILLPLYFYSINLPLVYVGLFFAFSEIAGCFGSLLGGYLVQKSGDKGVLLLSLLLHSIASFGYILLPYFTLTGLMVGFVCCLRVFRGGARELLEIAGSSYVKRFSLKKSQISQVQFLVGGKEIAKGIGFFASGLGLAYLGFIYSFFVLGMISTVTMFFCSWYLVPMTILPNKSTSKKPLVSRSIKFLGFARGLLYGGREVWLTIAAPVYLSSLAYSDFEVSRLLALALIVYGMTQPLFYFFLKGKINIRNFPIKKQKWKYRPILIWAMILLALQMVLIFFVLQWGELFWFVFSLYSFNIIYGFATVPHNHLHIKLAGKVRAATNITYYKFVSNLGRMAGVLLSSLIYELMGFTGCICAALIFFLGSAGMGTYLQKGKS